MTYVKRIARGAITRFVNKWFGSRSTGASIILCYKGEILLYASIAVLVGHERIRREIKTVIRRGRSAIPMDFRCLRAGWYRVAFLFRARPAESAIRLDFTFERVHVSRMKNRGLTVKMVIDVWSSEFTFTGAGLQRGRFTRKSGPWKGKI